MLRIGCQFSLDYFFYRRWQKVDHREFVLQVMKLKTSRNSRLATLSSYEAMEEDDMNVDD